LSKVTDASYMFEHVSGIQSLDTTNWQIGGAINVADMFARNASLKSLDLSNWDLTNATDVTDMLITTPALQNLKLGSKVVLATNSDGSAVLGDAPLNDTYTGKWINNEGQTFTADELMALYNDTSTAVPDTYIWQTDQTTVTAHDSEIEQSGQNTWKAADNFDTAMNADGQTLKAADMTVDGSVDTTTPGQYTVTYSYLNAAGNAVSAVAKVTVVASQVSVDAHNSTIMQGQAWTAADNFDSATDFDGNAVDFKDVAVTGADQVKTQTPGTYDVIYRYTDANGNIATKVAMITVKASQVSVDADDTTVTQGQAWKAADSFVGATDAKGNAVDFSQVTVTDADKVNTAVPGTYQVAYGVTDAYGNAVTKVITVTVQAKASTGSNTGSNTVTGDSSQADTIDPTTAGQQASAKATAQEMVMPSSQAVATTKPMGQTTKSAPKAAADQAKKLPQTNESSADGAVIVGAIMLGMTGLFSFFNKKRRTGK